jgi:actin-related protein 5
MARRAAPFEFSTAAPQRPGRASEAPPPGGVLVVDNGSWQCRAGWAGQPEPRVAFRALLHRPRARVRTPLRRQRLLYALRLSDAAAQSLPDGASVVGDYDTTLLRGVDPTRCSVRLPLP